jgi:glycosyltransferase involved in cell wall biosynthesis
MKGSAGKILMFTESRYPVDIRVRYEAESLAKAGNDVSVVSLQGKGAPRVEDVNGVHVYRIPILTVFKKTNSNGASGIGKIAIKLKSAVGYAVEYAYFTSLSLFHAIYLACTRGFNVVHAHNPPDTLFVVGAFSKIMGKKFVFDHHDLSPELYLSRFENKRPDFIYKVLVLMEKFSLKLADVVIATNESYKEIEVRRGGVVPGKIHVVRNGPKLNRVRKVPTDDRLKSQGKKILVYVGAINPQDGLDYLLRSLHRLVADLKRTDFHCVVIGRGDSLNDLKELCRELGLDEYVTFTGFIPDEDLVRYLSTADICLDPNPLNPLNEVSTWIKVMEYMAMGKPFVSFDLKETRFTAGDSAIFVKPNDVLEYAKAIAKLMDDPELRKTMGEYGFERVKSRFTWERSEENLLRAYGTLLDSGAS